MGFFSGKSESSQQNESWVPARQGLIDHLGMIEGQKDWQVYGGQQLADFNRDQLAQQQGVRDYVGGQGGQAANQMMRAGQDMLGSYQGAQNYYNQQLNGGMQNFNQGADLNMAAQYANNPYLNSQIDAAASDVTRNLYENQMPGIAAYSGGSGNLGSSRRGLLEAAATRDAGARIGNIASGMRNNSWNQGLNYANQIAQQNAQLNQQNMQNSAGQLQNMGNMGAGMMGQAQNFWSGQNAMLGNVGQQRYDQAQKGYDLASQNHYLAQSLPYQQAQMGTQIGMGPGVAFGENIGQQPNGGAFGAIMGPVMSMGSAAMGAYGGGK